jgi:hypothetical protein
MKYTLKLLLKGKDQAVIEVDSKAYNTIMNDLINDTQYISFQDKDGVLMLVKESEIQAMLFDSK